MLDVTLSFLLPIFLIIGWASISAIVPMPKATVNEYSNLTFRKYKIGMSFYLIVSSPSRYSVFRKNLYQLNFCTLVSL